MKNEIVEVQITEEMIQRAHEKADDMGALEGSITKGEGNFAGKLGEEIIAKFFNLQISEEENYDYDLIINGLKAEVKTKRCTSPPRLTFEQSVADFNIDQKADIYIFVRVIEGEDFCLGWIVGWFNKREYFERAVFHKKGEFDPDNNFTFKDDCYNMKIRDFKSIYLLKPRVKEKVQEKKKSKGKNIKKLFQRPENWENESEDGVYGINCIC